MELEPRSEDTPLPAWNDVVYVGSGNWNVPSTPGDETVLPPLQFQPQPTPPRQVLLPLVLFLVTCASTYLVGGWKFSLPLMFTLVCHELGHYFQALRYGVPASLPWFIPMPFNMFGTMGAVIVMRGRMPNRRALFDIGITGPLAGIGPALAFSYFGLQLSHVFNLQHYTGDGPMLGDSILFKLMSQSVFGVLPAGYDVMLHPMATAGWVGLFVTAFNLVPLGQLDGGHVLYSLLGRRSHVVAMLLYLAAIVVVVWTRTWVWSLLLVLLGIMGPRHPPTSDDQAPLGWGRAILGWATLVFFLLSFTPDPLKFTQ